MTGEVATDIAWSQFDENTLNFSSEIKSLMVGQEELASQALYAVEDQMRHLDLGLFLAELGEAKQLIKLWDKAKSTLANIAGAHLNYSFGWAPFLSDLSALKQEALGFNKAIQTLLSKGGMRQLYRHGHRAHGDFKKTASASWGNHETSANLEVFENVVIAYNLNLPTVLEQLDILRLFIDYYGLRPSGSLAWNLVPFSFVVDWFSNIGDVLKRLDKPYFDLDVFVQDACYSYHSSWTIQQDFEYYPTYPGNKVTLLRFVGTDYTRTPILPSAVGHTYGLGWDNGYGQTQMLLSASLLTTLVSGRH